MFLISFLRYHFHPVQSERPGGISGLPSGLSRSHLPRPLAVGVPALHPRLQHLAGRRTERRSGRREEGEEEERPQRAAETRVSLRAAIKGQNPNATFGEVSKIVASMWDSLGEEQKQVRGSPASIPDETKDAVGHL